MFTLYYAPNTCTLASHIALVDAGAPYALKLVDFGKTEQRQAAPSRPMFVERPRCAARARPAKPSLARSSTQQSLIY